MKKIIYGGCFILFLALLYVSTSIYVNLSIPYGNHLALIYYYGINDVKRGEVLSTLKYHPEDFFMSLFFSKAYVRLHDVECDLILTEEFNKPGKHYKNHVLGSIVAILKDKNLAKKNTKNDYMYQLMIKTIEKCGINDIDVKEFEHPLATAILSKNKFIVMELLQRGADPSLIVRNSNNKKYNVNAIEFTQIFADKAKTEEDKAIYLEMIDLMQHYMKKPEAKSSKID